ncbi:MAG: sugar kinase [Lachnospiraceae bacterium]|nr:sugar kinase [Lachnospiraceae bacterium]
MKIRQNAKYDLLVLTSMGVRITPADRQPVAASHRFEMYSTSAETNVANIPASLGKRVKVLTRFVAGSPIAAFIKGELRKRGLEYEGKEIAQGGPFGYRHQFNIADSGYGGRRPVVQNDRAGEVGRTIAPEDFDLERIFGEEGCKVLHLSGLIAALSPETGRCCVELAKAARAQGTLVSFDLNYRASFWEKRQEELRGVFSEIASQADLLIGNEEDFQLALGLKGPAAGEKPEGTEEFRELILRAREQFPQAGVFSTTLRTVESANRHRWGALLLADGKWYEEAQREIEVYDRIGGGDAYVGGLLYGLLNGWEPQRWMEFGWACGALAATLATDYAQPASEEEIWSIYRGNARVKR